MTSQRSLLLTSSLATRSQLYLNLLWSTHPSHHQRGGNSSNRRLNNSGLNGQLIICNDSSQSRSGIIHPTPSRSALWCSSPMSDFSLAPSKWPLARVLTLHPGKDGLTRVVTLKTATTILTRPIAKLAALNVTDSSSTSSSSC